MWKLEKPNSPQQPGRTLTVDPPDSLSIGSSDVIAPSLQIKGAGPTDLATLSIWINGRQVTSRVDAGARIVADDRFLQVQLPALRLGGGLHHLRASIENEDGTQVTIGEAYYGVGGDGPAGPVVLANGDLLVPAEEHGADKYYGYYKKGGEESYQPGGGPGGSPGGGPGGAQPDDGDQGEPDPDDKAKPIACRIVNVNLRPGPIVSERAEAASIEIVTTPADAGVDFSRNIFVTYIAVNQFLLGELDLATVTRRQLGRKGAQVLQTVSLGPGFYRVTGPRTVEILVSQINQFFRSSGTLPNLTFQVSGVPVRVTIGARCSGGGRRARVTLRIVDSPA